jgi:hypothetical protein
MKLSQLILMFGAFGLAIASAASTYHVTLAQKAVLGSTELKPGDYKVEVTGEKAMIRVGGKSIEAPVKIETGDQKFSNTMIDMDDQKHIKSIRVQGTSTTLVFSN